ncbi:MAG TPA: saccharopine dehydrogenase NADP-binding domain-containing protein [Croceibacterium sp.]|jgi:hypothetical protein
MSLRVALLGGYGNFGGYVARALANDPAIQLVICGRDRAKASAFAANLNAANPAESAIVDIDEPCDTLGDIAPQLVIHTVGPFQRQDHRVAEAAIAIGAHYCDMADARAFVAAIGQLDEAAKRAGVAVIAGASSVPCLTAAYLDASLAEFAVIKRVDYGIAAAQQTNRGLGTASAILSYVGRPFTTLQAGAMRRVFGWQGLHSEVYPQIGRRWFGYCDIPDLALFPGRYPGLEDLRFCAGHEIAALHFGTWLLSWGVRLRVLPRLDRWSGFLLRVSFLFDALGTGTSGFHMYVDGVDKNGSPLIRKHWIIARQAHGPNIPCIPVILIAKRLARGEKIEPGARPCIDLISLEEYRDALKGLDVSFVDS